MCTEEGLLWNACRAAKYMWGGNFVVSRHPVWDQTKFGTFFQCGQNAS